MNPSSLVKGTTKILSYATRTIVILAVFFGMISLYIHFSTPVEKQLSYQDLLTLIQTSNKSAMANALEKDPSDDMKIAVAIRSKIMCEITGDLCTGNLSQKEAFRQSITGKVTKLAMFPLANPPSSGLYVATRAVEKAGFVPQAYAQEVSNRRGLGFASIEHISKIWEALRNFSYIVIALIMVGIGFMIMFRMKMNAQTVISIENSIPRIILALIFITFSFAIAGFLIDLMYISIIIIAGVFGAMNIKDMNPSQIVDTYMFSHPGTLLNGIMGGPSVGISGIFWVLPRAIVSAFGDSVELIMNGIGSALGAYFVVHPVTEYITSNFMPGVKGAINASFFIGAEGVIDFPRLIKGLVKPNLNGILYASFLLFIGFTIARIIVGFIIFVTAVILAVRLFTLLLSSYIRVLMFIMFAPVILLAEALPGKSIFTSWFKTLFAEIATFPITIVIFLVGALVLKSSFSVEACNLLQADTSTCGIGSFPFLWGFDPQSFSIIMGFGFLYLGPEMIVSLKKMINPNPLSFADNASLGMFFGSIGGVGKFSAGGLSRHAGRGISNLAFDTLGKSPGRLGSLFKAIGEAANRGHR